MDDRQRLSGYVDVWWGSIRSFTDLLDDLADDDWRRPTDLPGWDVHACAAHTAHLEAVLAGEPEEAPSADPTDGATSLIGMYTEQGVVARRDRTPAELVDEIRRAATTRYARLLADPPTDGRAKPTPIFRGVGWDWQTLLRNRPLDVWMHEQDVRRAVDRPGGLDSPAAVHVVDYLAESLGYVLAKRAGAPTGTRSCCGSTATSRWPSWSTSRAAGAARTTCPRHPRSVWPWTASPSSWRPVAAASPVTWW